MHTYFRRLTLMMRKRAEHFRDEKYGSKSKEMEYKVIWKKLGIEWCAWFAEEAAWWMPIKCVFLKVKGFEFFFFSFEKRLESLKLLLTEEY